MARTTSSFSMNSMPQGAILRLVVESALTPKSTSFKVATVVRQQLMQQTVVNNPPQFREHRKKSPNCKMTLLLDLDSAPAHQNWNGKYLQSSAWIAGALHEAPTFVKTEAGRKVETASAMPEHCVLSVPSKEIALP
jgi:hypothetical protein